MPTIDRPTNIYVNCSFIERYGQIGKPVSPNELVIRLTNFFSSPQGINFLSNTYERLTGKPALGFSEIRAQLIQQGFFQFVFIAKLATRAGERESFCLIISKENEAFATDRLTEDEYDLLSQYHQLLPDQFVKPLVFDYSDLTLYSSVFCPEHLELDFKIDGSGGRQGFYINSFRSSKNFSNKEQDQLMEEIVKILTLAYEANGHKAIGGLKISAGDFILHYKDKDHFDMKLICARMAIEQSIPSFIHSLVEYSIGLSTIPGLEKMTHLGYLFDKQTIFNGLVKAFMAKSLSRSAAIKKATEWMGQHFQAFDNGELKSLIRFWAKLRHEAGFDGLPIYRYQRADAAKSCSEV